MESILNKSRILAMHDLPSISNAICSLASWGCCHLCMLRYLGENDPNIYQNVSENDADKWLTSILKSSSKDNSERTESGVCVSCLGILQREYNSKEFLDQLSKSVESLNFEYQTFLCSISVPVSLMLRDHSILLLMRELYPDINSYSTTGYNSNKSIGIASVKDVWKWINGPALASRLKVHFNQSSLFEVILTFEHNQSASECEFLTDVYPDIFRRRKGRRGDIYTRANVGKALEEISDDLFRRCYSCPPRRIETMVKLQPLSCETKSLYIAGRYNKMSRILSQTPWFVDGQRRTETSIEELITQPINKVVCASTTKFSASGREDIDVRMLGRGRPFAIEFVNPRKMTFTAADMITIQDEINSGTSDIAVRDLQVVSKEDTCILKDGEEEKIKRYSALCWTEQALTESQLLELIRSIGEIELKQKTPLRVLHRRPLATRLRTVHSVNMKCFIDEHHFVIGLSTQAGTYVKEFVHGDFGRTHPNLSTILNTRCDILELDVESVELDWPKSL